MEELAPVPKFRNPNHEFKTAARRLALTLTYLEMLSPDLDSRTLKKLAESILALVDGEGRSLPERKIADAQVVEMVWRNSQCVLNHRGKCPLLVFGEQMADELNEFFKEDE